MLETKNNAVTQNLQTLVTEVLQFLDNSSDNELIKIFNKLNDSKYKKGVRSYYNVITKEFVASPVPGETTFRSVCERKNGNYKLWVESVKNAIKESYSRKILLDEKQLSVELSNGSASYLEFPMELVATLVGKNPLSYSSKLIDMIGYKFEKKVFSNISISNWDELTVNMSNFSWFIYTPEEFKEDLKKSVGSALKYFYSYIRCCEKTNHKIINLSDFFNILNKTSLESVHYLSSISEITKAIDTLNNVESSISIYTSMVECINFNTYDSDKTDFKVTYGYINNKIDINGLYEYSRESYYFSEIPTNYVHIPQKVFDKISKFEKVAKELQELNNSGKNKFMQFSDIDVVHFISTKYFTPYPDEEALNEKSKYLYCEISNFE